ncbi:MAG: aminotransferase class I/II-fold pyridoxal phosphate-dependent enzyme [Pseudomonadota bacterium]
MQRALGDLWHYGDGTHHEMRGALAAHLGVGPENVIVGEGIDGLLGTLCRLMLDPGDQIVASDSAYPTFLFHVAAQNARHIAVPFKDDRPDLEGLLAAAERTQPKIVYLSNPDNPSGAWFTGEQIARFAAALPATTLFVLDEAYVEYAPAGTAVPIDITAPKMLRFRTFSKAYGLAGLRVGYGFGAAPIVRAFDKIRNHFAISPVADAGARAALADAQYLADIVKRNAEGRARLAAIAMEHGLSALASATNFLAIDCGKDRAFAAAVLDAVLARGVFIRKPGIAPLDRCIRVTVGTDDDLSAFAAALGPALEDAEVSASRHAAE